MKKFVIFILSLLLLIGILGIPAIAFQGDGGPGGPGHMSCACEYPWVYPYYVCEGGHPCDEGYIGVCGEWNGKCDELTVDCTEPRHDPCDYL